MEIEEILDKYQGTIVTTKNNLRLKYFDAATNIVRKMCSEYASGKYGDHVIVLSDRQMMLQTIFDNAPNDERSMIFHILVSKFDKALRIAVELMNRKYGKGKWPSQIIE